MNYQVEKSVFFPEDYIDEEGNYLSKLINDGAYDIVLTSTYHFCARLDVSLPVIFLGDLTYDIYKKYFKSPGELMKMALYVVQQ
ncbi:MAG: hypothetical protein K2J00_03460 [Bacteroidaceae bacterium]|nr:hypothetical protein [Bacteroidaceae bacterium]